MISKKELLNHSDLINKSIWQINKLLGCSSIIYFDLSFFYFLNKNSAVNFGYELTHPDIISSAKIHWIDKRPDYYFDKNNYQKDSGEGYIQKLSHDIKTKRYFEDDESSYPQNRGIELSQYLEKKDINFQIKRIEFITDVFKKSSAILVFNKTIHESDFQKIERVLYNTLLKIYSTHTGHFIRYKKQQEAYTNNRLHELKGALNALFKLNIFRLDQLFQVENNNEEKNNNDGFGRIILKNTSVHQWYVIPENEKFNKLKKYLATWFDSSTLLKETISGYNKDSLKDYIYQVYQLANEFDVLNKSHNTLKPTDIDIQRKNQRYEKSLLASSPSLIIDTMSNIKYSKIRDSNNANFDLHFFQLLLSVLSNILKHNYKKNNIRLEISENKPYIYLAFCNLIESKDKRLINQTIDNKAYGSKQVIQSFAEKIDAELTDFEATCTEFYTIVRFNSTNE